MALATVPFIVDKIMSAVAKKKRKHPTQAGGSKKVKTSSITALRREVVANRPEMKSVDNNAQFFFDNLATSNANVVCINQLAQGDEFYNREGREVKLHKLQFQYTILPGPNYPKPVDRVKVALVYDRSSSGVVPTVQDIFQDIDYTGFAKTDAEAGLNLNNRKRFRLLLHRYHVLPHLAASSSEQQLLTSDQDNMTFKHFFNFKTPLEIIYSGSSANTSAINSGAIWLIAYSNESSSASEYWVLNFSARLRYTG